MACVPLSFHADDSTFNIENALYLAHASDIAYHRKPKAAADDRLGLKAVAFRNKFTRTRGFLGVCDTHAVLSYRGSDPVTLPNWITDLVMQLVERADYDGRVHKGFSSVLRRTWSTVEAILQEVGDRPLFLTGHSMGGALAVLTGCRLGKMGRPPAAIYTYGSPRVGDRIFCSGYSLPTYRIVNGLDLIPEMPLVALKRILPKATGFMRKKLLDQLPRLADRAPAYDHVKTFVYMDRDGAIVTDPDVEPWHRHAVARAIATRGKSFHEGLTDHMISNYIRGLEGKIGKRQTGVRRRVRVD